MKPIMLEVCVDDVSGLEAAVEGGADRIELCSALDVGGLTPSAGLMAHAARLPVPCYAMIRPRAGDFIYGTSDVEVMKEDIRLAATCGMAGVVFGANLSDGRLDRETLIELSATVPQMPRTLHRAFDLVPDIEEAIAIAIECGFERILTSGRAVSASKGLTDLQTAIRIANRRISIMPGAGVNLDSVNGILAELDISELHSSCSSTVEIGSPTIIAFGFSGSQVRRTNANIVRALKQRLSG